MRVVVFLVTVVVAGLAGWGLALALPLWAAVPLAVCVGLGLGLLGAAVAEELER